MPITLRQLLVVSSDSVRTKSLSATCRTLDWLHQINALCLGPALGSLYQTLEYDYAPLSGTPSHSVLSEGLELRERESPVNSSYAAVVETDTLLCSGQATESDKPIMRQDAHSEASEPRGASAHCHGASISAVMRQSRLLVLHRDTAGLCYGKPQS
ncbi:hypothetical protein WMY93_018607 [Mugilogobius chulae]|uniref:Uncharacterized protein n=1 Tax=Mugilogobius chulae TaxID=88201 RepID=A0AAW0NM61_9GOBI